MLTTVGQVVELPGEKSLDAVTGLSGSGPAYVFLVAEASIEAGELVGLDRPTSAALVIQTLLGASHLLAETGDPLRAASRGHLARVARPPRACRRWNERGAQRHRCEAVSAATDRAGELAA